MSSKPIRANLHCRHYSYKNGPVCALGEDLSAPKAFVPCMPPGTFSAAPGQCPKREEYTDEERATWKVYVRESLEGYAKALAAIPKADPKNKGGSGTIPCAKCGTRTIHWARSTYNNHLRAQCTTPECVNVIQ